MIWQDSRIAVRFLGRTPGFTIAAALTIAVAVAMSTSVFSVVNAMFLRPLPYKDAGRLAIIWSTDAAKGRGPVSFDDFADWTRNSKTISSGAVYSAYYHPTLTGSGTAERLSAILISHDYFTVMGVEPVLGRFFTPEEDRDGPDNVVVLSQDMWRNRFQSDPQVIGRSILLNARPHVIVGVAGADLFPLPPGLAGAPPQLYRPVGEPFSPGSRDGRHLQTLVRLRPGATIEQAQAEIDVRCRQMERENAADARLAARIVTLRQDLTRNVGTAILALQGAVLLLLLLACANVANLLLARSTARQQEFAVRAALGASRRRLARMLLTESVVLGLLGGSGGIVLAAWATTALSAFTARILPNAGAISIDFRVLSFSLLLSTAAALLFGLAPLFHLEGESFDPSMRSGKRIVGGRGNRSRQALVAVQIAAAVVLLTATGLIGQSFLRLRDINPGFDPNNILTASLALPSARYPDSEAVTKFFDRAISAASAIPGVRTAAIVSVLPMSGNFDRTSFDILGKTFPPGSMAGPDRYIVSPGYFATVGIPLRRGRLLTEQDDQNHQPVCVISETAARSWFANESPLGRKIRAGSATGNYDKSPFREVVGVVGDVAQYGLGLPATPQIYMPEKQYPERYQTMLVRTASHPEAIASALRQTVIAIDQEQPIYDVATLEEIVSNTMATRRIGLWMLIGFALTALCLASLGVYGVVSYWVTQRTPEFGIRMVLGAQPAAILSMALRGGLRMIGVGLIAGALGSLAVVRLIRAFLFEPSGGDLPALLALGFVLALIAFAACYVPARRAAAVDPMVALRYE